MDIPKVFTSITNGFLTRLKDLPDWFQIVWLLMFLGLLLFSGYGFFYLKHTVNLEIRSESSPEEKILKPLEIEFTGPKKMSQIKKSNNGKIEDLKVHFGEHKLKVISPKGYEIAEDNKLLDFNKYNKNLLIFLKEKEPFRNNNDTHTVRIETSGSTIVSTSPDKVILYTIIDSIGSTDKKPLENLTAGNFTITERYKQVSKEAEILSLKPLSSPIQAILVLDNSKTIAPVTEQVKNAVKEFFNVLKKNLKDPSKSNTRIAILPICRKNSDKVGDCLYHSSTPSLIWFSLDSKNKTELEHQIEDKMKLENLGDKTPLWDGIEEALKKLKNSDDNKSYQLILCITDGINDGGMIKEYSTLENLLQTSYGEIPIFSIGYKGSQGLNAQDLVQISKISGAGQDNIGSFMDVKPEELKSFYQQIAKSITKSYELSWRPTIKPTIKDVDVPVQVSIEIKYQGKDEKIFQTQIDKEYTLKSDSLDRKRIE